MPTQRTYDHDLGTGFGFYITYSLFPLYNPRFRIVCHNPYITLIFQASTEPDPSPKPLPALFQSHEAPVIHVGVLKIRGPFLGSGCEDLNLLAYVRGL